MTNIETQAQISKLQKLPGVLRAADVEPSSRLLEAVEYSTVQLERNGVQQAQRQVNQASPEKLPEAVQQLAYAYSVEVVGWEHPRFQEDLERARFTRLFDALMADEGSIFDALCQSFNAVAPSFTQAVSQLPNMSVTGPWEMSPPEFEALTQAKSTAAELHRFWAAYTTVAQVLGYLTGNKNEGWGVSVLQLGEPETAEQVKDAARQIAASGNFDKDPYQPLEPFVSLVQYEIPLKLIHPADALERKPQEVPSFV